MSLAAQPPEPTIWPRARVGTVVLTLAVAVTTAVVAVALGGTGWHVVAGVTFVVCTAVAMESLQALWLPVVVGVGMTWSLLEGREGTEAIVMVPVIVGVVATAELLAVVARLEMIVHRPPTADLVRTGLVALVTAVAALLTIMIGALQGPEGFAAVVLGAVACVVLAVLLVENSKRS